MIGRAGRRRIGNDNTWPGFVDALSTLLLVIIFLLSMFALSQFFLGQALSGRDEALQRLRDRVAELGSLLRLERQSNTELRQNISQLSASLQSANAEKEAFSDRIAELESELTSAESRLAGLRAEREQAGEALSDLREQFQDTQDDLESERQLTARQRDEIAQLNNNISALRQQLARLEAALQASETKDREQQAIIADLGRRLNVALARKVEELAGYRSEFFGRLRDVLGEREDIRVEGERFIFQSELLFESGSAALGPEGRAQMRQVAATLLDISATIPPDLDWVLRVDGHTDTVPIRTERFPSNWELSAARAISVVKFLISQGVPPERLAATGFGEFQPLVEGTSPEALRRNRRIEMRVTQR